MAKKKSYRGKYYSPKRRAIYAKGDQIDHLELFERDDWVCGICDGNINRKFRFPHKWAATVDHIVPLSQGGTHTWNNVQAAHAHCNFTKGDECDSTLEVKGGIIIA